MAKIRLALLPSFQNGNTVKNPAPGGATNEMRQMEILTDYYVEQLQTNFKDYEIEWKRFSTNPQSLDTSDHSGLHKMQAAARAWMLQKPAGQVGVCLNIHSDAPGKTPIGSHVAYCYDAKDPNSRGLGLAICRRIAPVFKTFKVVPVDYTGYIMAVDQAHTNTPILIEHGDHTVYSDNVVLQTKPWDVAYAALQGLIEYFAVPQRVVASDLWAGIPADFVEFCKPHPELGVPFVKAMEFQTDADGDQILKLIDKDGMVRWLVKRKYTDEFAILNFVKKVP